MWSDHETDFDFLGFSHLSLAVETVIARPDLLPATIGIYGDWGSGKSSLLKMVSSSLSQREGVVVVPLNGWLFEGYDDARAAMMETILEAVAANRTITAKGLGIAKSLIQRIDWLRAFGKAAKYGVGALTGGPLGVAIAASTDVADLAKKVIADVKEVTHDEWEQFLKDEPQHAARQTIRKFRDDFTLLIQQTKITTLLVTIDDLDRCLPDTIIETLEAIKLFLFVPKTAFLIGADERLVQYAVRRRFPEFPGERAEVGRDYLEKLIQFAIRVPALSRNEMTTYLGLLFSQNAKVPEAQLKELATWALSPESISEGRALDFSAVKAKISTPSADLQENLELASRLAPVLFVGLNGNPRQCKRFLNTLLMRIGMAKARTVELKQPVLAKLMLLEYFRPESFKKLAKAQSEQEGKCRELRDAESLVSPDIRGKAASSNGKSYGKQRGSTSGAQKAAVTSKEEDQLELVSWLNDEWLKDWLGIEPSLSVIDMRPYFYFARDVLGPMTGAVQRLSPRAQDVLRRFLNDGDAVRTMAMKEAVAIDAADAAAILEELANRVRRSDELSGDNSILRRLFDWGRCRNELVGQILLIVQSLPDLNLPVWTITQLEDITKDTASVEDARKLIQKWSTTSTNTSLKRAAVARLQSGNTKGTR
ncbi:KAP family P-loop NTPase fold protein [Lacunimicrobium album]